MEGTTRGKKRQLFDERLLQAESRVSLIEKREESGRKDYAAQKGRSHSVRAGLSKRVKRKRRKGGKQWGAMNATTYANQDNSEKREQDEKSSA